MKHTVSSRPMVVFGFRVFRCLILVLTIAVCAVVHPQQRWTEAQANDWYAKQPWPVGADFLPSTAINELEMWQADTFDDATIDRELGWAEAAGMNTMRVFLHNLLWDSSSGWIDF
jgi:hypothetical protein